MTIIGFLALPAIGHLNTILPLAKELQGRGHDVAVFSILDFKKKIESVDIPCQIFGADNFPLGSIAPIYKKLGDLKGKAAHAYTLKLSNRFTYNLLEDAPKLLQTMGAQGLVVDYGERGGGTIADYLKIPFVTVCTALIRGDHGRVPGETSKVLTMINDYREQWQLPPYKTINACCSSIAQISQQPPEFDLPRTHRTKLPDCFHFTGPFHSKETREKIDFPWYRIENKPLVYASLGTLLNRHYGIFEIIAKACVGFDFQLVISMGSRVEDKTVQALSHNHVVVNYAPQLELLSRASLTITHGGLNTTLESLSRGVPLIVIPLANDEFGIADRIQWKGLGIVISVQDLTVEKLHHAIQKIISTESFQLRAAQMQQAIFNAGGVDKAGDIIEKAFSV